MEKSWGYCKNKTENQKQEALVQILRTSEKSWIQGTLFDRSSSNTSIPTLKPSTTQGPTSWRLITHYWTLHSTPERRNPTPPTRTPTQASLTKKPWQDTDTTPPKVRKLHNKENSTNSQIYKGHPKCSNITKMKRERNTQQVKEQEKCPLNHTKEEEIGNLPEK